MVQDNHDERLGGRMPIGTTDGVVYVQNNESPNRMIVFRRGLPTAADLAAR